jgi:hypothetical protein
MQTCRNFGLKGKPTSLWNPQSNGIIERTHLVIGNMLRTFEDNNRDLPPIMPFWSFISAASWAICSTYHTALQATPGQLVFGRDMLLSIPFRADWAQMKIRKQGLSNKGVLRENATRIQHKYNAGDIGQVCRVISPSNIISHFSWKCPAPTSSSESVPPNTPSPTAPSRVMTQTVRLSGDPPARRCTNSREMKQMRVME